MDCDTFDALIRGITNRSSRRGVVRVGLGALAASVLAAGGLGDEDAAARNKEKKQKKKKKDEQTTRGRICKSPRPVICGAGCCPSIFSNCCQDTDGPVNQTYCAPNSDVCCPITDGYAGYSCSAAFPKCCPATLSEPEGDCTDAEGTCCTNAQGDQSCRSDFPVCCPNTPGNPFQGSYCCAEGEDCCVSGGDCPSNNCQGGCCVPVVQAALAARGPGHGRSGRASRRRVPRTRLTPAT